MNNPCKNVSGDPLTDSEKAARLAALESMLLWAVMEFRVWGLRDQAEKLVNWKEGE